MIPTLNHPLGMPYGRHLQYLESTGTQYIDTGVKPDYANGDRTEISFYRAGYPLYQPCVFGCRETIYVNGFYVLPLAMSANGTVSRKEITWASKIQDYTIAVDDNNITIDGAILAAMPECVTCTVNMTLFALLNGNGTIQAYYSGMKLYDWKYYRNGMLAQHLIPVLDKSGVPCLYDTVTRTFKYNAGTGTFNYA